MNDCPFCSYPSAEAIGMALPLNRGCRTSKAQEYGCPTDFFVQCFNCFSRGPVATCDLTAITLWNMRLPTK